MSWFDVRMEWDPWAALPLHNPWVNLEEGGGRAWRGRGRGFQWKEDPKGKRFPMGRGSNGKRFPVERDSQWKEAPIEKRFSIGRGSQWKGAPNGKRIPKERDSQWEEAPKLPFTVLVPGWGFWWIKWRH